MKRVLMTGAAGMVGSNVLAYLLRETDWTFTCLCSWRHRGHPLNVPRDRRVEVITHDLTAPLPDFGAFDFVLNLASESHVDRSIADPRAFIENNVSLLLSMLEYARAHPPELFVQFSSDEASPQDRMQLAPSNPYAASKAAQEVIALSYARTFGVPIVITRSNNIVGPNQHPEKYVPKLAELIRADRLVQVHAVGGKPGRRYYNAVENVADALLFILSYDWPTLPRRVDIPGGEEVDNEQMALLISEILDVRVRYEIVDAEQVRPGYDQSYSEADELLCDLGWKPPLTLREGLAWLR